MIVAWVAAIVLAGALVTAGKIEALRGKPRSRWLSFAGGVALAYVFVQLFPEVMRAYKHTRKLAGLSPWLAGHLLFLTSLGGALLLFGIERAAKATAERRQQRGCEARSAAWVFWLHAALLLVYTGMIGYLLAREGKEAATPTAVLGVIMALHFTGLAVALTEDYRELYARSGQWLLGAAVLGGVALGQATALPATAFHLTIGVLAGAIVFSVIKEEIPADKQSSFLAVAAGAAAGVTLLRLG